MGVAWKSSWEIDVGAVGEPYSGYSAQLVGRTRSLAARLESPGTPGKRTVIGDSQVERLYCAAPLLYTGSTSPSARHITFYIFILSSMANPFSLHTTFSTPKIIEYGGHGRSSFHDPPLALLLLSSLSLPPLHFWLTLVIDRT
jgi:hypothetical protein